jgi:hypothetical protein
MKKRIFLKTVVLFLIIGVPFILNSKDNNDELILIPVKKGTTWGYVSPNSEKEISCIYDGALVFSEGLAPVLKNDKSGNLVVPISLDYARGFSEGLAVVGFDFLGGFGGQHGFGYGYVNRSKGKLPSYEYRDAGDFSEGLAAVKKTEKWGYINKSEDEVIPFEYDFAEDFSEGFAAVEKDNKWGVINKKGEIVIEIIYDDIKWP